MVVQVDQVGVGGVKWKFDIYDFPSVASTMWVLMCGAEARFKRIWIQGLNSVWILG